MVAKTESSASVLPVKKPEHPRIYVRFMGARTKINESHTFHFPQCKNEKEAMELSMKLVDDIFKEKT